MKNGVTTKFQVLTGCVLIVGLAMWLFFPVMPKNEPTWKAHPLSEWLVAYDCNLRFDPGDGRRSVFNDDEIDRALNEIGPAALPFLNQWLTAKPNRWKPWMNQRLNRLSWIRFRFQDDAPNLQGLAEIGFMAYSTNAQPLLPELIKLSHSDDPELRMVAYEAAFFTRPEKEMFLPLAGEALKEKDSGVQRMAAQWMVQRFSDEAEKAGLRSRFPIFYQNQKIEETGLSRQLP